MADLRFPEPPFTRKGGDVDTYRAVWPGFDGEVAVADPYRWLEDGSSSEVADWVAAHYQRTREALDARPSRGRWIERLSALAALPTTMAVRLAGGRMFSLERPAGADQYVLCVCSMAAPTEATVLVDPAAMALDAAVAIDWFHPSHDGSLLAYGLSEGGTENSTLHVMRVATGEVLPLRIPNCRAASVAFLPDGSGFFYAVYPDGDEYHRHIRFRDITQPSGADDPVVFDRLPTEQSWPDVSLSADGRWLLVHVMVGWSHVDVHLLDRTTNVWHVVVEGVAANSQMQVVGDRLVGCTFRDAPNGRVVWASVDEPHTWHTLVPERNDSVLGAFAIDDQSNDVLVVASRVAIDRLERWSLPTAESVESALVATVSLGVAGVVALDSDAGTTVVATSEFGAPVRVQRVVGGDVRPFGDDRGDDTSAVLPDITVRQVFYRSTDGTQVPMFVAHRADVVPSAATPLVLTGYGGFAISESPIWMPNLAAWCGAGGVFAVAGLRGGYEYGERWHEAGRRGNKQQVFDDFFAAADWLVAEGFTSRERLAVYGGSNGGLLMGAVITQRPDLAPAVWCAVPLLDMIRFPQFLIARLWTDEYGDPDVPDEFGWLWHYSPYHRVVDGAAYPAVVFTTAEGDTRVDPCHARKMAARLVEASSTQAERPVFLLQSGRAGHGAGKPTAMRVAEWADMLSFFCWQLGLDDDVVAAATPEAFRP